jgi:pyruvate formate lyase activating enzyme
VSAAVITGGEPTLCEDLPDLVGCFRERGWAVKLDTNGSRPDVLRPLLPKLDYVAMDVKAGPDRHAELTGFSDVERIRESIALIRESGVAHEFRTTLIEPFHDDEQLEQIAAMVAGARRYVLQPFVPREEMPDPGYRALLRTAPDRLAEAQRLMDGCADEVLVRGD